LIDSHRSITRKNDRSVIEIEYENQKPECTFKPNTEESKRTMSSCTTTKTNNHNLNQYSAIAFSSRSSSVESKNKQNFKED
jgi:hypothetical protein